MTQREKALEQILSKTFAGGDVRRRELRLTSEEAAYITAKYAARVRPMGPGGEKNWYEIIFQGAEQ